MQILVLGGTRFIGAATVHRLVEMGHRVAVFHRGRTEAPLPPGVYHIHGDRQRLADFMDEFRGLSPEVVVDMLPLTAEDGSRLVSLFKGIAPRLVAISSGDVYRAYDRFRRADPGLPDPVPLTEDSALRDRLYPHRDQAHNPDDLYYRYEKILMERAVMSDPDMPATVLRLPMVYGPGDYQHRLCDYLKRMDDGRPAILIPRHLAPWRGMRGYVEDVAHAIALCAIHDRAAGRIYHVADRENLTEVEWIRRIARATGWNGRIIALDNEHLPLHLEPEYDLSQELALDCSRIRGELEYAELTDPDEAMRRTVAWERANPLQQLDVSQFDYAAEDEALAAVPYHDRMVGGRDSPNGYG
jgi:nucleoside-diphosphate-sugar epimerase